jgi:L-ribulose-5-phosphate 4-epimerase
MSSLDQLKQTVWKCNLDLQKHGLVIQTFGNVSGIDRETGIIAIKPSGIEYADLTPDKIVLVDLDNKIVDSKHNPSSDTKTHIELYKKFPKIGGVVHTHSAYATAWAQSKLDIPCFGTTHADYVQGAIPCTAVMTDTQIKGDYEQETGYQIISRFKKLSYEQCEMVIVACHGPFTWGITPGKAVYNSIMLEEISKMALLTVSVNPKIAGIKKSLIDKHFLRKHGKNAYYGQKKT